MESEVEKLAQKVEKQVKIIEKPAERTDSSVYEELIKGERPEAECGDEWDGRGCGRSNLMGEVGLGHKKL